MKKSKQSRRYIEVKQSKKTGQWYWVMKGGNGEKMAHSESIKNKTYFISLMSDFADIGFEIRWGKFKV